MASSLLLYRMCLGAARLAAPAFTSSGTKVARGLEGRRDAHGALARWGRSERDPARPCVWVHAPSVGESYQARAVIRELRVLRPDLQVVFTHFSPSAEAIAGRMEADVRAYLPWDLVRPVSEVLDAVRPDVVVFTKTEVWPVLTAEADRRDVPVGLIAATVPEDAGRMTWAARRFLAATWRRLDFACAIAKPDAERLKFLGVRADKVRITGDPGVDSAAKRAAAADPSARHLAPFLADPRPTIVAGSTWPSDEAVVVPALEKTFADFGELRAVVVPHEPDTTGVRALTARFEKGGRTVRTLSQVEARGDVEGADVVLVDRVGVLADLYSIGDLAYVGGGFHDAGLHSVLEPAAVRLPVVIGPRHTNARAAGSLLEAGGARAVETAEAMAEVFLEWLSDEDAREYAGASAFGYIDAHRGAALKTATGLSELFPADSA